MPSIDISEAQAETLGSVREELADRHVGEYGHVRARDAVAFLLDRYAGDDVAVVTAILEERLGECSYQELQRLAGVTDGVEATGKEADLRSRLASARAAYVLEPGTWGETAGSTVDVEGSTADTEAAAVAEDVGDDGGGGSGSRLERMMGLLEEYDDAWEEADAEDGKYVVTLPDGSTETARTKEDVRAVLFRHYE